MERVEVTNQPYDRGVERLMTVIRGEPGVTFNRLVEKASMSRTRASVLLSRLSDSGRVLVVHGQRGTKAYSPGPADGGPQPEPVEVEQKQHTPQRFKVRIVLNGALLHVLSTTEPTVHEVAGRIVTVDLTPVEGTAHGDTIGFIRWSDVSAISWRLA